MRSPGPVTSICGDGHWSALLAGGRGRTSTSSSTQRCCVWMGCAEEQPCAGVRAAPGATGAHGWIRCSPWGSHALRMCTPSACHLLACVPAACQCHGHLVLPICTGNVTLPAPGGALPSPSSMGAESGPMPEPSLASPCLALCEQVPQRRSALASSRAGCFTKPRIPLGCPCYSRQRLWALEQGGGNHETPPLVRVGAGGC